MEVSLPNLIAWMEQIFVIATLGWLLPVLFRIRHPRTQLAWCHLVLVVCAVLPFAEPWQHPVIHRTTVSAPEINLAGTGGGSNQTAPVKPPAPTAVQPAIAPIRGGVALQLSWNQIVLWTMAAGVVLRMVWLLAGLWRIRRYRIGAMPLYPIPESVRAAAALTQTDALFCISSHVTGPVMLGWLAPVVLLPESFLTLDNEAQCGIVCHELLHVRRHDWLVTLFEELVAALFWFNPAIWPLTGQMRLAREELVDSEVVQLTASRDPYIDALLTIARGQSVSDLAPAPAPLFLRRRHLTRRMDSLLKEISMSKSRLLSSYGSIAAMLTLATWAVVGSRPLIGSPQVILDPAVLTPQIAQVLTPPGALMQMRTPLPQSGGVRGPSLPVPPDVHELAAGPIQPAIAAADRAAAFALLDRAEQNAKMHLGTMPPYDLKISFTAGGGVQYTGSGEMTESWASGQSWRWTAKLGGFSMVRIGSRGQTADVQPVAMVPMRVQMLRDAIFWAARTPGPNTMVRTVATQLNGKPVTCVLTSNMPPVATTTRLWEESEHCIDNASGSIQIYSVAPGTYVIYGYGRNQQFHGRVVPDQLTAYVGGSVALEAQVNITDLSQAGASSFVITPEMSGAGPAMRLITAQRFAVNTGDVSGTAKPVIVHATISPDGIVSDEEVSAASDPGLASSALDLVKKTSFGSSPGEQRDVYINVRFGN